MRGYARPPLFMCFPHSANLYYSRQGGTTVDFCADADDLSEDRSLEMSSIQWPGYTAALTSGNIALDCH